jgi:hypothetical protein
MRSAGKLGTVLLLVAATALGQSGAKSGPSPAASGPDFALSAGYTFLSLPIANVGHQNLNGFDLGGHLDFSPRWGATVDISYARGSEVASTGHSTYVLSALVGPVFYPMEWKSDRVFVHALVGAGMVDSAVPLKGARLVGYMTRFSDAVGGGIEHHIKGPFSVRISADLLRTTFVNGTAVARGQSDLRATVSLMFRGSGR